jgi:hypothetical protein
MSDALSTAWIDGYIDEGGTMQTIATTPAKSTIKRQRGVKQIISLAKRQGVTVDDIVTQILNASQDELSAYVMYSGETPVSDPTGLALQAALIRATTVGTIAKICSVPDDTALQILEQHEQDALETMSYDINKKLSPDVQAALAIVMQSVSETMQSLGSTGNMQNLMSDLSTFVAAWENSMASEKVQPAGSTTPPANTVGNGYAGRFGRRNNDDDGGVDAALASTPGFDPTDFATPIDSTNPGIPDDTDFEIPALIPVSSTLAPVTTVAPTTNVTAPVLTNASNLPQVNSSTVANAQYGTTAGGVINAFTTIGNVVAGIAKTVTATTGTVSTAINTAGAGALQTWVQNNMVEVIGIILFIGIVIYVATRRK